MNPPQSSTPIDCWYYLNENAVAGPISTEAARELAPDTLVCAEGSKDWQLAQVAFSGLPVQARTRFRTLPRIVQVPEEKKPRRWTQSVGIGFLCIVGLFYVWIDSDLKDAHKRELETERKYLAEEGQAVANEMLTANSNHDYSRVAEITQRKKEFVKRAEQHLEDRKE